MRDKPQAGVVIPPRIILGLFTIPPHHGPSMAVKGRKPSKGDEMRRGAWIAALVLVVLAGIAIGVGAYNAGVSHGLEQTGRAVEVVRVGRGYGFFPFGFFLFPLFFFGLFFLIRSAFWGRRGHGHWEAGPGGPGQWGRGREMFDEWHRRQHEQGTGDQPGAGGEPAAV
jgi:hypothetical protein